MKPREVLREAERRFMPLGAALGVSAGPMAAIGQAAAGTGDGGWHIGLITAILGVLIGGLSLPVFLRPETPEARPLSLGFGATFTCAVALLAGGLAAFPMGAVVASACGLGAGLAGALVWRFQPLEAASRNLILTGLVATMVGTGLALAVAP
jgi:hypothetical protein